RAQKAGGPARGEQLLRVGAGPRGARRRDLDVQAAIVGARGSALAAARRVSPCGVQHVSGVRHGLDSFLVLPGSAGRGQGVTPKKSDGPRVTGRRRATPPPEVTW